MFWWDKGERFPISHSARRDNESTSKGAPFQVGWRLLSCVVRYWKLSNKESRPPASALSPNTKLCSISQKRGVWEELFYVFKYYNGLFGIDSVLFMRGLWLLSLYWPLCWCFTLYLQFWRDVEFNELTNCMLMNVNWPTEMCVLSVWMQDKFWCIWGFPNERLQVKRERKRSRETVCVTSLCLVFTQYPKCVTLGCCGNTE